MKLEFVSNVLSMVVGFYLMLSTVMPLTYILISIKIDLESKAIVFQFELQGVYLIMNHCLESSDNFTAITHKLVISFFTYFVTRDGFRTPTLSKT